MVSLIVTVIVSPGENGVTTLVGIAVSPGSAWPQGTLFCGSPRLLCRAQLAGAIRLK